MFRLHVYLLAMLVLVGCGGRMFTDLGNGVAVPSETIDTISRENGITHAQARSLLRTKSERKRIAEHAEEYEISFDEAKKQLEHLGQHHQQGATGSRPTLPK